MTTPQTGGAAIYDANCTGCHSDPWAGPALDDALPRFRHVAGARACNIEGSIFGTSVFPNGVPEMQFLQGLSSAEIDALADHLNSQATSGLFLMTSGDDPTSGICCPTRDIHAALGKTYDEIIRRFREASLCQPKKQRRAKRLRD